MNIVTPVFGHLSAQPKPLASALRPVIPAEPLPPSAATNQTAPNQTAPGQPASDRTAPTTQLRMACLAQLDPATIANMPPDRLALEVERVLSEIATAQHFQLNAREQRKLAGELVDDMLGLGPLEPLFEDDSITDIMVNGPNRVFVERHGKVPRTSPISPSASPRRSAGGSTNRARWSTRG
jgi:pilus assembly protein CpaF